MVKSNTKDLRILSSFRSKFDLFCSTIFVVWNCWRWPLGWMHSIMKPFINKIQTIFKFRNCIWWTDKFSVGIRKALSSPRTSNYTTISNRRIYFVRVRISKWEFCPFIIRAYEWAAFPKLCFLFFLVFPFSSLILYHI